MFGRGPEATTLVRTVKPDNAHNGHCTSQLYKISMNGPMHGIGGRSAAVAGELLRL